MPRSSAPSRCALWAGVFLLAGCGGADKQAAPDSKRTPSDPPPVAPPPPAVTLAEAVEQKLCVVDSITDVAFSTPHLRFLLKPLVETKPRVTIPAGLKLIPTEGLPDHAPDGTFVTVLPCTGDLYPKSNTGLTVWCARLTPETRWAKAYRYETLPPGDPVAKLLAAAQSLQPAPDWHALQVAVWAVAANADLKTVRRTEISIHADHGSAVILGESRRLAPNVRTLDDALQLLKTAGLFRPDLKMVQESEAEIKQALDDYANGVKALQAVHTLGYYASRPEPYAVLCAVFEKHPEAKVKYFREAALKYLWPLQVRTGPEGPKVHAELHALLKRARESEVDPRLKQEFNRWIEWAEKKTAPKP